MVHPTEVLELANCRRWRDHREFDLCILTQAAKTFALMHRVYGGDGDLWLTLRTRSASSGLTSRGSRQARHYLGKHLKYMMNWYWIELYLTAAEDGRVLGSP